MKTFILAVLLMGEVMAFGPSSILTHRSNTVSQLHAAAGIATKKKPNPIDKYIRSPINNYMNALPWNARRLEEREKRGMRRELASMYRFLGVSHNCEFEELQEATDSLILKAGNDIKRKVIIEKTRDDILQIRLNERVKGMSKVNSEALAATSLEERDSVTEKSEKKKKKEASVDKKAKPDFWKRVIVRGDDQYKRQTIKTFGRIAALNTIVVPLSNNLGQILLATYCIGAIKYRGINKKSDYELGQYRGYGFGGAKNMYDAHDRSHYGFANTMGLSIFLVAKIGGFIFVPPPVRNNVVGKRLCYLVESALCGLMVYPLKPYNGE